MKLCGTRDFDAISYKLAEAEERFPQSQETMRSRELPYKIAINNHRILSIDTANRMITFSLKEYRNQGKKTTMTLTTEDFIKRFQNHILPKGFTRIRHYGYLSSS